MASLTSHDLVVLFADAAKAIETDKDRLSALDGAIGDGDHGITMAMGFAAVTKALGELDLATADPTTVFNTAAKSFLNAVGASSGPLYATAFMRAAAAVKGRPVLGRDEMAAVVAAIARGIADRGKGAPGDKTMLDAWLPAADAMAVATAEGRTLKECLAAAATAAATGAAATRAMVASRGRASRLGERARGHVDPGAASAVTILEAFAASRAVDERAASAGRAEAAGGC